ncbi:TetR family transcriptional regulator OS=Streptomyces microflavus OX=1919 GN=HUT09_00685 PE=4 SV=1 [Streptomyces microflavus]
MTKQVRAARTRQALIRSAAIVFEQHGYGQARLALISSGAGVSTGALHFHFEEQGRGRPGRGRGGLARSAGGVRRHPPPDGHPCRTSLVDTSHAWWTCSAATR